jgi:hypothetical protein
MSMRYPGVVAALALLWCSSPPVPTAAQEPVVRSVFFFSPTCPHCAVVIQQYLPVFFQVYGGVPDVWVNDSVPERERALFLMSNRQLTILLIDATKPVGRALYDSSMVSYPVTKEREGVPRLILGDTVLVGEREIPGRFHQLMRRALARGGQDWPAIAGLAEALSVMPDSIVRE